MKQKRFVSMIGALVVILAAVAFITGCPQANGSKDKAVYVSKTEHEGIAVTHTVIFKAGGTWIQRTDMPGQSFVTMQGTYTGDPSKDGTIAIKLTKQRNEKGALVDVEGGDATLSITIEGGKCTVMGIVYTRQ